MAKKGTIRKEKKTACKSLICRLLRMVGVERIDWHNALSICLREDLEKAPRLTWNRYRQTFWTFFCEHQTFGYLSTKSYWKQGSYDHRYGSTSPRYCLPHIHGWIPLWRYDNNPSCCPPHPVVVFEQTAQTHLADVFAVILRSRLSGARGCSWDDNS